MPASPACPPKEQLREFALGVISEVEATAIAEHLDQCAACELTVDSLELSGDTVVNAILQPAVIDPYAAEPGCRKAEALVQELGADLSTQTLPGPAGAGTETLPAEQMGPYRLLTRIGVGGMGAVYKAVHTKLDKVVALKVLPKSHTQDASALARFEREVRAVGKLDHPHIVRATDAGEADGTQYLVMELVDGLDLSRIVHRRGPLPISAACEVIRQAAMGLQEAHRHGMVHRDIKPSNLMLARSPRPDEPPVVKILDLGLALLTNDAAPAGSELTSVNQVVGTIDYLPPEQLADTHHVDIRADIYSLGATLYRLLTGEPPFPTSEYKTSYLKLAAIANGTIEPVERRRPGLPAALAAIVAKMLSRSSADRFSTPQQVADALKPFCAGHDLAGLLELMPDGPASVSADAASTSHGLPRTETTQRPSGLTPFVRRALTGAALAALCAVIVITITRPDGSKTTLEVEGDTRIKISPEKIEIETEETPVAAVPPVPAVPKNHALEFDGKSSYVELPTLKLDHSRPLTMEAIIVPKSDQTGAVIGNGRVALHFPVVSGLGRPLQGRLIIGSRTAGFTEAISTLPSRPGDVLHVAGVLDGTTAKLYINGKLRSASPVTTPVDPTNFFPLIGADPPRENPSARFTGQIDELRISRSARYAADYNPLPRLEADAETLALYHFDDGKGDILTDVSGNGHHGKIHHGTWVAGIVDRAQPPQSEGKSAEEANRRAVAWVLGIGGKVTVKQGGKLTTLAAAGALPAGDYSLEIDLSKNKMVDDAGLENLRGATAIRYLRLEETKITGLIPLGTLTRLETLLLGGPQIEPADLEILTTLPALKSVAFGISIAASASHTTDAAMEVLCRLPHLQSLNFGGKDSPLTDAGLAHLRRVPQLMSLDLRSGTVTNDGLIHVAALRNLKSLGIDFSQVTGDGLRHLAALDNLEMLYLTQPNFEDGDVEKLPAFPQLKTLSFLFCPRLTGSGFAALESLLPNLNRLVLHQTGVTDEGLRQVVKALPHLTWLGLADSRHITDAGLEPLKEMEKLSTLDLTACAPITDAAIPTLERLPRLTYLNISRTKGITPEGVARLRQSRPNVRVQQ